MERGGTRRLCLGAHCSGRSTRARRRITPSTMTMTMSLLLCGGYYFCRAFVTRDAGYRGRFTVDRGAPQQGHDRPVTAGKRDGSIVGPLEAPVPRSPLFSSFYGKFDGDLSDDDEDDDDDEDEYSDLDDAAVADFRNKMSNLFGESEGTTKSTESPPEQPPKPSSVGEIDELIDYARSKGKERQRLEDALMGGSEGGSDVGGDVDVAASSAAGGDWARPAASIKSGVVLVANPERFCSDIGGGRGKETKPRRREQQPSISLLSKFGLTLPPPAEIGADRRADLLPVLIVVDDGGDVDDGNDGTAAEKEAKERKPEKSKFEQFLSGLGVGDDGDGDSGGGGDGPRPRAVLLNRRTGYLLGDLEQPSGIDPSRSTPILEKFCIQPLWFGGVDNDGDAPPSSSSSNGNNNSNRRSGGGLDMLHLCPAVEGSKKLTDDGVYWGGDPAQAQDAMDDAGSSPSSPDRVYTGFDFKFFVQSTSWTSRRDLEIEIESGLWYAADVSRDVLFKPRDRMGTRRAKPLWTEIMELLGGEYRAVRDELYQDQEDSTPPLS